MELEYSEKKLTEPVSEFLIERCLRDCSDARNKGLGPFVILSDDKRMMQTQMDDDDKFVLQYWENGQQFQCVKFVSEKEAISAFISFYRNDEKWRGSLIWEIDHSHDDDEVDPAETSLWTHILFIVVCLVFVVAAAYQNR